MLDAYMYKDVYGEVVFQRKQWVMIALSGVIASLLVLWIFLAVEGRLPRDSSDNVQTGNHLYDDRDLGGPDTSTRVEPPPQDISETQADHDQILPDSSEFFSIQVAAFRDLEKAEELRDEFLSEGHPARIERPGPTEERWYRVLIGKLHTEHDAITFGEKLCKQKKLTYVIIRRRTDEGTKPLRK
jgi:hypothetical protein